MLETSAFQIFQGGNSTLTDTFDKTKFSLEMDVSLNSQPRIVGFYRPDWLTKYRLMKIHNFPFSPSPSIVK